MIYVPDSSAALKWVLPEPLSDKARRLRDDYRAAVHELLLMGEFGRGDFCCGEYCLT